MDNNIDSDALDSFLDDEVKTQKKTEEAEEKAKKVIMDRREGLIERVDKIFVTKDGKQLLREVY